MTREEALERFQKNQVEPLVQQTLFSLDAAVRERMEVLSQEFGPRCREAFQRIVQLQETNQLGEIEFIVVTVLRTNLAEGTYQVPIKACGSHWWLDEVQVDVGSCCGEFVFGYWEDMGNQLMEQRKRYVGKTIPQDVEAILQQQVEPFLLYLAKLAKYHILELTQTEEFLQIKKGDRIQIQVGEYMGVTEPIYQEQIRGNDPVRLLEMVEQKKRDWLCFADLKGLDFTRKDCSESDLRFADFRGSEFGECDLSYSLLIGAVFQGCCMEGADFSHSILNEAIFANGRLKGAKFRTILAYSGLEQEEIWNRPGYRPIDFKFADLQGADFTGADLRGVTLEGADLRGADFTGADLREATLEGAILTDAVFSKEQLV